MNKTRDLYLDNKSLGSDPHRYTIATVENIGKTANRQEKQTEHKKATKRERKGIGTTRKIVEIKGKAKMDRNPHPRSANFDHDFPGWVEQ